MKGVFVTGTGTDVGKTVVAAWLVRNWAADYWKPVQSGTGQGEDAVRVRVLAGVPAERIHPCAYRLAAPLSPHEAAAQEGCRIDLGAIRPPPTPRPLVVEGAGGALVPLNETALMTDLMRRLDLPVLIVARSGLGTINHTLLTVEALRRRGLSVAGVVMNGPPNPGNRRAIEQFGQIAVLAELPSLSPLSATSLAALPPPPWTP